MTPRPPLPSLIAVALGECLRRPVSVAEIGMGPSTAPDALGLDFPRDPSDAVRGAADYWSDVDRRTMIGSVFTLGAYTAPVTRWLIHPADEPSGHRPSHGQRVGHTDIADLWEAVSRAQRGDSKYGGGSDQANLVTTCLAERAAPLLRGDYTESVGRKLFTVTAELSRVRAWAAVDIGDHHTAQRHFIQALRLARAGGAVDMGCYVLSTMALQTVLRGYPSEAVDMAQGAYERARHSASPRVLAFAKLMEARAHARARDAPAATAALLASETLLEQSREGMEPHWIANITHARLAADATELYRDLRNPRAALDWNKQADTMSATAYTRSVGLRLTATATAHLHEQELEQALAVAGRAVELIKTVRSSRARDYVRAFTTELAPWNREAQVHEFIRSARSQLAS